MRRLALLCSLLLAASVPVRADGSGDPYEDLAQKLTHMAAKKMQDKKIAVLTFEYIDKRPSPGGRTVAEKLTNRFVELGETTVIERGMVEKVIKELEFQNNATVDPESAKKLGKGLGVEAIVIGTLEDSSFGNVEVNARIIKTETYEIVAAGTTRVKKTWSDEPPPQDNASPAMQQSAPAPVSRQSSSKKGRAYLDLLIGSSNATMNFQTSTSFGSGSMNGLATNNSGLFGMRVGGFGDIFGGDFEMSHVVHGNLRQTANLNGYTFPGLNVPQDFLHVETFEMSGDVLMRFPTGPTVIPYFGLGLGLSFNTVQSNSAGVWLAQGGGGRLNQMSTGYTFRVPFGLRVHVADPLDVFLEGRMWTNTFTFNQGLAGVSDTINEQGFQFLGGFGVTF